MDNIDFGMFKLPRNVVREIVERAGYRLIPQERVIRTVEIGHVESETIEQTRPSFRKAVAHSIIAEMLEVGAIEFEESPHPENLYRGIPLTVIRATAYFVKGIK